MPLFAGSPFLQNPMPLFAPPPKSNAIVCPAIKMQYHFCWHPLPCYVCRLFDLYTFAVVLYCCDRLIPEDERHHIRLAEALLVADDDM